MAYESESEVMQELEDEYSGEGEEEVEGEYEGESSLEGEGWLGAIGNVASSLLGESEEEYEAETAFESEAEEEISPIRKIYPDAMMEHLGERAFESESEEEAAEHFLPLIGMAASKLLPVAAKALAPHAKKLLPRMAQAVTRATPGLTNGIGKMTRTLHRNPRTRHLVRTMPAIARRTVGSIARQAAQGRRVTPGTATRILARQARQVLANPRQRRQALRRHQNLERTFHRRYARGIARPHPQVGRYSTGAAARTYTAPYAAAGAPAYAAATAYRPGFVAGAQPRYGTCTCPPCPSCAGAATAQAPMAAAPPGTATPSFTPSPAYCRACGQLLR